MYCTYLRQKGVDHVPVLIGERPLVDASNLYHQLMRRLHLANLGQPPGGLWQCEAYKKRHESEAPQSHLLMLPVPNCEGQEHHRHADGWRFNHGVILSW